MTHTYSDMTSVRVRGCLCVSVSVSVSESANESGYVSESVSDEKLGRE